MKKGLSKTILFIGGAIAVIALSVSLAVLATRSDYGGEKFENAVKRIIAENSKQGEEIRISELLGEEDTRALLDKILEGFSASDLTEKQRQMLADKLSSLLLEEDGLKVLQGALLTDEGRKCLSELISKELESAIRDGVITEENFKQQYDSYFESLKNELLKASGDVNLSDAERAKVAEALKASLGDSIKGEKGDKGDTGSGSSGSSGYTPQKGKDYFTQTEITGFVNTIETDIREFVSSHESQTVVDMTERIRSEATAELNERLTVVDASVSENRVNIEAVRLALTDIAAEHAARLDTADAGIAQNATNIELNSVAIQSCETAIAACNTLLDIANTNISLNAADIEALRQTLIALESALTERIDDADAGISLNAADIEALRQTLIALESALTERIDDADAGISQSAYDIEALQASLSDAQYDLSVRIDSSNENISQNAAEIEALRLALAECVTAIEACNTGLYDIIANRTTFELVEEGGINKLYITDLGPLVGATGLMGASAPEEDGEVADDSSESDASSAPALTSAPLLSSAQPKEQTDPAPAQETKSETTEKAGKSDEASKPEAKSGTTDEAGKNSAASAPESTTEAKNNTAEGTVSGDKALAPESTPEVTKESTPKEAPTESTSGGV